MFSMANDIEETRVLSEYLTAPAINTYLHNDSFPADHKVSAPTFVTAVQKLLCLK